MNKYIFSILSLCLLISCGTSFKLLLDENENEVEVEILYSENCFSNTLFYDTNSSIQFYTIESRFDFLNPSPYKFLKPNEDGRYYFDFHDGPYYYEIVGTGGDILFSGLFVYPDDLSLKNILSLGKGRKLGRVSEKDSGVPISGAEVIHTSEITGEEFITYSDSRGGICIELDAGRYTVEINHPQFYSYFPPDGFNVFINNSKGISNFILKRK